MEFQAEFIQKNGLTPEQVQALTPEIENHVADLKKGWDGKANIDAEKIIQGAVDLATNKMGISGEEFKRKDGEKYAEWMSRVTPSFVDSALAKEKSALQQKQRELDEKIKTGGSEALKTELETVKTKLDTYKIMEAEYSEWKEADYKGKYQQAADQLTGLKLNVAFQSIKPTFPETVNKYEAAAKWNEFVSLVKEKYNIELDDKNEPIAIDKENEHKKIKLQSLVEKDQVITELSKGRNITGLGGNKEKENIEGVPFKVEKDADKATISKTIKEYLTGEEKLRVTDSKYAYKFAEYYNKIVQKTA